MKTVCLAKLNRLIPRSRCGSMMMEMIVAVGILTTATVPIAYSFMAEARLCRQYYFRSVAMEVVDGEMEVLAAGEWAVYPEGTQAYKVTAAAVSSLPAGAFTLTRQGKRLRLDWKPENTRQAKPFAREVTLP
jgi:hypothetical protein